MRYEVPCKFCAVPVEVDQPNTSNIQIEEAECKECYAFRRSNQGKELFGFENKTIRREPLPPLKPTRYILEAPKL